MSTKAVKTSVTKAQTKNQTTNKVNEIKAIKTNEIEKVLKHASFLKKAQSALLWYDDKLSTIEEMIKDNEVNIESFNDEISITDEEHSNNTIKIKLEQKVGYREESIVTIDSPDIVQMFMKFLGDYFEKRKEALVDKVLKSEAEYKS